MSVRIGRSGKSEEPSSNKPTHPAKAEADASDLSGEEGAAQGKPYGQDLGERFIGDATKDR